MLKLTHPHVAAVAVVAMPELVMGERACAFVVPREENNSTVEEMVAFLKEKHLALFKIPERLELVKVLPIVAADQKVDKKALQQMIRDKLVEEGSI